jgi:hypothetical protein
MPYGIFYLFFGPHFGILSGISSSKAVEDGNPSSTIRIHSNVVGPILRLTLKGGK